MNRRNELRFQIYTNAKVSPFDEPERDIEAQMVDVSASGIRFIADVELPEDQIVIVETDQHLILADIRNCKARGIRFGVGAERVHSMAKFILPRSTAKTERNQALIADYHCRLREELERPVVPGTPRAQGAAARFAPEAQPPKVEAEPVALKPAGEESSAPVDAAIPVIATPPAWKWRTMAFVALSAAAILLISLPGLLGNRETAAPSELAEKTSQEPALVVDSVVPAAAASRTEKSAVSVATRGRSWVMVCADDRMVFSKMFDAGSQDRVEFENRAVVRVGSAGLADISMDGRPLGPLGQAGQVRAIELTPGASRILGEGDTGDCAAAQ